MVRRRLPIPISEAWAWQVQAACRGMSSSYFFHPQNERGPEREARIHRAKQICADCPVIDVCRQQALESQETYGIWGGLSEDERRNLLGRHRSASARGERTLSDERQRTGRPEVGGLRDR